MDKALKEIRSIWSSRASRDIGELWDSIIQMTDDPLEVADLIAEAGQKDHSVAISADAMDEINTLAIDAASEAKE